MGLTPVVEFVGGAAAKTMQERFGRLELVDAAGVESDSLAVDIWSAGLAEWPKDGQQISVRIGYKETGLRDMGLFTLSRVSEQIPQRILTLTFTAAQFQVFSPGEFRERRDATFEGKTILAIVSLIAARHGYSPRVAPDLGKIVIDHVNQDGETDIQFLHRLATRFDAVCKPVDSYLVFGRRGQAKSLTGRSLEPVLLRYDPAASVPSDAGFTQAVIASADRRKYSGAKARWRDPGAADDTQVAVGESPYRVLPTIYKTEQEAVQNAEAALREAKRQGDSLAIDCPGDPRIAAEGLLELQGFPSARANITWSCDRVTHTIAKNGYRTRVEATLPGDSGAD
jgi:uncharacterized protein